VLARDERVLGIPAVIGPPHLAHERRHGLTGQQVRSSRLVHDTHALDAEYTREVDAR